MNYLDVNEVKEHLRSLTRVSEATAFLPDQFAALSCNHFSIYFGAGKLAFSEPHLSLNNLLYYDSLQVMIRETIKDTFIDICPMLDPRFENFSWAKKFSYEKYLGGQSKLKPSYMGAYLSQQEVLQLIREVYKVSRLRLFF